MRKAIRFILLLCCTALFIVSFAACQNEEGAKDSFKPESAIALWEKIDSTMNGVVSVKTVGTTNVVYYYMGYRFEMNGVSNIVTTETVHYMDSNVVITSDELSSEQTMRSVEAYYDGKMYSAMNDGIYDQKFCSEMTKEEYRENYNKGLNLREIGLTNCTDLAFSEADNSWQLSFSGYTKKTIDQVLSSLQMTDDMLGAPIVDMEIKIVADSDFRVVKTEVSFVFSGEASEDNALPEFSSVMEYSGHNEVTFDPADLQPDTYTLVEDVRILDDISEALSAKQDASSGKFTLSLTTTYEMQGQKSTYHEESAVEYGRKNGAYYYFISTEMEGKKFVIQYQNGEQTVIADGQTQSVSQVEEEAKAFIDSLIDTARYNGGAVSAIEKKADGEYILTIEKLDLSSYAPAMAGSGIELTSGSQQIVVAFKDGEIVKMESSVAFKGVYDGEDVEVFNESALVFGDTADSVDR